jgi:hypothetical protein
MPGGGTPAPALRGIERCDSERAEESPEARGPGGFRLRKTASLPNRASSPPRARSSGFERRGRGRRRPSPRRWRGPNGQGGTFGHISEPGARSLEDGWHCREARDLALRKLASIRERMTGAAYHGKNPVRSGRKLHSKHGFRVLPDHSHPEGGGIRQDFSFQLRRKMILISIEWIPSMALRASRHTLSAMTIAPATCRRVPRTPRMPPDSRPTDRPRP